MGHKNVCFDCKKAFNLGSDYENIRVTNCPDCGQEMNLLTHRFRPPKKNSIKKWEVARFLVESGFPYQHLPEIKDYPENKRDAIILINKYQAYKKKRE